MTSDYTTYLQSTAWQERRTGCLLRAGHKCEACTGTHRLQAHHLTYERIFNEPLEDLMALCEHCHDALHRWLDAKGQRVEQYGRKQTAKLIRDVSWQARKLKKKTRRFELSIPGELRGADLKMFQGSAVGRRNWTLKAMESETGRSFTKYKHGANGRLARKNK